MLSHCLELANGTIVAVVNVPMMSTNRKAADSTYRLSRLTGDDVRWIYVIAVVIEKFVQTLPPQGNCRVANQAQVCRQTTKHNGLFKYLLPKATCKAVAIRIADKQS